MHVVLDVETITSVTIIFNGGENDFIPKFFHRDSIAVFRKCSHEQWATLTIIVCVIKSWY